MSHDMVNFLQINILTVEQCMSFELHGNANLAGGKLKVDLRELINSW